MKLLLKSLGMMMLGEGAVVALLPKRYINAVKRNAPGKFAAKLKSLKKRPKLARVIGIAEIAGGAALTWQALRR